MIFVSARLTRSRSPNDIAAERMVSHCLQRSIQCPSAPSRSSREAAPHCVSEPLCMASSCDSSLAQYAMAAADSDDVYDDVMALIEGAKLAANRKNFDGLTACLDSAVAIYEENPSQVHGERSQLRALLTFIRSAQHLG